MRKVIVWGIGNDYDKIYNALRYEILKGNIEIVALVAKKEDIYMSTLDGWKVICKDEIIDYEYDYIVITSQAYFEEILSEAVELGISRERVIPGRVFSIFNFDFIRYVKLIENSITIISDDCWGGLLSKYLYLPMNSPTINVWFSPADFMKLVSDIPYYVNARIEMIQEGDLKRSKYPIGSMGEGDKSILINFAHERSFESGVRNWDRRKGRINYDNIFVKMAMNGNENDAEQILEKYAQIMYKKVCFYPGDTSMENVHYLKRFETHNYLSNNRNTVDRIMFNAYCRGVREFTKSVDVLKLLNGEANYIRDK